jgi:hypothetical protein
MHYLLIEFVMRLVECIFESLLRPLYSSEYVLDVLLIAINMGVINCTCFTHFNLINKKIKLVYKENL